MLTHHRATNTQSPPLVRTTATTIQILGLPTTQYIGMLALVFVVVLATTTTITVTTATTISSSSSS